MKKVRRHLHRGCNTSSTRSAFAQLMTCRLLNSYWVLAILVCLLGVVLFALTTQRVAHASSPNSAIITTTSSAINWQGTATGGAAVGDPLLGLVGAEDLCIEGTTCDTFTLTVGGTSADWAAAQKLVHIHL